MSERMRLVARLEEGESPEELSREFGIKRKTAYKFWARYRELGPAGLYDLSRAPKSIPHRTPQETIDLAIALRKEHASWGPKKLKSVLEKRHPGVAFPAASSIGYWLTRAGLVTKKPRPKPVADAPTSSLTVPTAPNEVWATDYKGQFRLGNRAYCYPLTITDVASRFILGCEGFDAINGDEAWCAFDAVFREYGLPRIIRSDNGSPFAATRGLAGLTVLSAKWLRCGIRHQRIEPGHPQQNGQHERMHRTLKAETTRPAGVNLLQQQERFDDFLVEFNQVRPHEALGQRPPAEVYVRSDREYRGLPELDYPLHDDVRTVRAPGLIKKGRDAIYLTAALVGEPVGLREVDDGRWLISYATLDLGTYDERTRSFEAANFSELSPMCPV